MPEHLRALVVILLLATFVFAIARKPALDFVASSTYGRRRNLWLALCAVAFIVHSFWIYAVIATLFLLALNRSEKTPLALYFLLLFLLPAASVEIPGFGLINYLVALNHPRLLALIVLLPIALTLRRQSTAAPYGRYWADKLLVIYLLLIVLLTLRSTTFTDVLRQAFYLLIDVFLPYYVASRGARNLASFKDVLFFLVLAALLLAVVGIFEFARHWLLYNTIPGVLGLKWGYGAYLGRGESLRASASVGQPIALGYVMAVAIGIYLYVSQQVRSISARRFGGFLLIGGLIASLSRGPWIGAAVIYASFISTGRTAIRKLLAIALVGILSLPFLTVLPGGQKILNLLPFIGNAERENITYREKLIDNALIVIERNPFFGSVNYSAAPEMEAMRQGQGIIDIVNTYLEIALEYGVVGLSIFTGIFLSVLWGIWKPMRSFNDPDHEMARLGRSLFATLIGVMTIIFTVSSITIIPIVYWSLLGLGVGYTHMVREYHRAQIL